MLEIRFLSNEKLIMDGNVLDSKVSGKTLAIIAMLVLRPGHTVQKRELMDSLWPESNEEAAKYNLRFNLWQLRKALGDAKGDEFIKNEKSSVSITKGYAYVCDVEEILECQPEKIRDKARLKGLMDMFSGELFMDEYFPGCSEFNDMIIMKRYSLESMHLKILRRYIDLALSGDNLALAGDDSDSLLGALDDALGIDPYDENLAKIKLETLIGKGMKREATGFYHMFRMKLTADIGQEPSAELKKLAGSIPKDESGEKRRLVLRVFPMKETGMFWISEIIRALMEDGGLDAGKYLSEDQREVLAYVSDRLGKCCCRPSGARVLDTFVNFLDKIIKAGHDILIVDMNPKQCVQFDEFVHFARMRWGGRVTYKSEKR